MDEVTHLALSVLIGSAFVVFIYMLFCLWKALKIGYFRITAFLTGRVTAESDDTARVELESFDIVIDREGVPRCPHCLHSLEHSKTYIDFREEKN